MRAILILLALLAVPTHAEQWRGTINDGFNKVELTRSDRIGLTVATIAIIADGYTTVRRTRGDSNCVEGNPIIRAIAGDQPSAGAMAALSAAQIGMIYYGTRETRRNRPPDEPIRALWWGAGLRFGLAAWNASLSCR